MKTIGISLLAAAFILAVWTPVRREESNASVPPPSPSLVEGVPFVEHTDLERATSQYITSHGLPAFMDEWYNLVGAGPQARLTPKNEALAGSLGIQVSPERLPIRLRRADILPVVHVSRIMADRRRLADFFADPDRLPELGEAQRLFLEWHFRASRDYAFVLEREGRRKVVGWNTWAEMDGPDDFAMYTFGQIGCTAAVAVSSDGSAHLSHYDQVVDKAQAYVLDHFLQRHPDTEVYVCGVNAELLAEFLSQRYAGRKIRTHVKRTYLGLGYTLRVARSNGEFSITAARRPVSDDYIPSLTHVKYGFLPVFGRFGQIFPPDDDAFELLTFEAFEGS